MNKVQRSRIAPAVMLITLGLVLYFLQFLGENSRPVVLTSLGGVFIAGYFASRSYFLLVSGGILTGIGIGMFGDPVGWSFLTHDFTSIGLGIGFLLIYFLRLIYEKRSHWWPLIPALVLFLLGFQTWRNFRVFIFSKRGWPLILVIVGTLMLLGVFGKGRRKGQD